MRFPKSFLTQLKEKVDLYDLISEYTELKKAGPYLYIGHCPHPNHNDSNASFRVYTDVNTWSCFGCHCDKKDKEQGNYGTDCIAFIEWMTNKSFIEAVKYLAERVNLPLPESKHEELLVRNYKLMKKYESDMSEEALEYLNDRGISAAEISQWNIGFDKADNRIVFPLIDSYNNVIGFNRRLITKETKGVSKKYIHSSDSDIFKKANYLYGMNHIDRTYDYIVLTEGVMDCILARKYGLRNVICGLGTSLSQNQIDTISRTGKELIVVYDSDRKGIDTMNKVMPLLADNGIRSKLVILPEDKDLADISIEYKHGIEQYILKNKMTYGYYLIKNAVNEFNKELYELYDKYNILFEDAMNLAPKSEKNTIKAYINNNVYGKDVVINDMREVQE